MFSGDQVIDVPVACSLSKAAFVERKALVLQLTAHVLERRYLPDGVSLRFASRPEMLSEIVAFVELERACCPFIRFRIDVEPSGSGITLEMTGTEQALSVIRELVPAPGPDL